jgi:hypothetical protein
MFVFNVASRRAADREMTMPVFLGNIKKFFPEIETLPHNDSYSFFKIISIFSSGLIDFFYNVGFKASGKKDQRMFVSLVGN